MRRTRRQRYTHQNLNDLWKSVLHGVDPELRGDIQALPVHEYKEKVVSYGYNRRADESSYDIKRNHAVASVPLMELLSVRAAFRRYRSSALLGGVDFFGYGGSIVCHDRIPALGRSLIPFMFYEWHRHEEGTADGRCSR